VKPTEASRFTDAYYAVLARDPNTPPGPTAINRELGKTRLLNVLNGRMSALRISLLKQTGFIKDPDGEELFGRWRRP
jgi:hypothetical protein